MSGLHRKRPSGPDLDDLFNLGSAHDFADYALPGEFSAALMVRFGLLGMRPTGPEHIR